MKTALIAGATGLIGKQLLDYLLEHGPYDEVKVVTRTPVTRIHPRLHHIVVDFDKLESFADKLAADDVYCALGTTMKKAGSKKAFEKVDLEYPLTLAKLARAQGATQFLLVSAMGAAKGSGVYYNRVKGLLEEAVAKTGYEALHIFRPSLLLGPREEKRSGEDAAKTFFRIFDFIIPTKYKAIDSAKVARAMVHFATQHQPGVHVHESEAMQGF